MTIGITIGIPEVLQQHSHYLIMKCAHAVFLLIGLAFSITIIWLIANHSAGKSTERNLHVRVPTISEVFLFFEKGNDRQLVIAHYLIFVIMAQESIHMWIGYIIARWMIIRPQLSTDMLILYKTPIAAPFEPSPFNIFQRAEASTVESITYHAIVSTLWILTRYGFHFSGFFLIQTTIRCASLSLRLLHIMKTGKNCQRTET